MQVKFNATLRVKINNKIVKMTVITSVIPIGLRHTLPGLVEVGLHSVRILLPYRIGI